MFYMQLIQTLCWLLQTMFETKKKAERASVDVPRAQMQVGGASRQQTCSQNCWLTRRSRGRQRAGAAEPEQAVMSRRYVSKSDIAEAAGVSANSQMHDDKRWPGAVGWLARRIGVGRAPESVTCRRCEEGGSLGLSRLAAAGGLCSAVRYA